MGANRGSGIEVPFTLSVYGPYYIFQPKCLPISSQLPVPGFSCPRFFLSRFFGRCGDFDRMRGIMSFKARSAVTLTQGCIVVAVLLLESACAAGARDRVLANSLANDETREAAIASIVASGRPKVPLLLSWARKAPIQNECGLFTGLADALGRLKTKEAIPFLIRNISEYRSCGVSLAPWLKAPEVIEWNLPAVGALVRIGPDSSKALMTAFPQMTGEEDRRAAIFVISRINGVPEARGFLESAMARASRERYWAEEGIKSLGTDPARNK